MKIKVAMLAAALLMLAGCGSGGSMSSTQASPHPASAGVSPACKSARQELQYESSNPKANPTYLREYKELVQEECGSAARTRWARIQHEQTPQGEAEKTVEIEENAEKVHEEAAEVEKVIKQRQAERVANELEGR